jgi:DNA-binding response OmpR family regulator
VSGELLFVVHPDPAVCEEVGQALHRASYKVLAFGDQTQARERIDHQQFLLPDAVLMSLGAPGSSNGAGPPLVEHLRSHPLTEDLPVVVLGTGEEGERRRALRLGLTSILMPPFDDEELVLTTRLALEHHRDERLVSGSIAQLSVPDLLQTAEASRKSGTFTFRHRGKTGVLWMNAGRLADAEIDDGRRGRQAVLAVAGWTEGTFEVDFSDVSVPSRIQEPTSALLLEAMRLADEEQAAREATPPHAALDDPPPPPPRDLGTVHRALTLVNVAVSYGLDHLEPALLARRLEAVRRDLAPENPALDLFSVSPEARVTVDLESDAWRAVPPEALVVATARWLRTLYARLEHALPGRFPLERLGAITEAIADDLKSLGFDRELGLPRRASGIPQDEEH